MRQGYTGELFSLQRTQSQMLFNETDEVGTEEGKETATMGAPQRQGTFLKYETPRGEWTEFACESRIVPQHA